MDLSLIGPTAVWACQALAVFWATPAGNLTIDVAGNAVYDLLKGAFCRPAAVGALEEAKADPKNIDNQQALMVQIKKQLQEDPAFAEELLKLVPAQTRATWNTLSQHVEGDGNTAIQNTGSDVQIHITR